jgi:hypothetical protein
LVLTPRCIGEDITAEGAEGYLVALIGAAGNASIVM